MRMNKTSDFKNFANKVLRKFSHWNHDKAERKIRYWAENFFIKQPVFYLNQIDKSLKAKELPQNVFLVKGMPFQPYTKTCIKNSFEGSVKSSGANKGAEVYRESNDEIFTLVSASAYTLTTSSVPEGLNIKMYNWWNL